MREYIQEYISVILDQRDWSWTIVCSVFFLFILMIRRLFLKPLIARAKMLDKSSYHEIKTNYLNQCALGWIFLLISTALIGLMWFSHLPFPLSHQDSLLVFGVIILALVSIQLHLTAFSSACIKAIKKLQDSQKVL